LLDWIRRHTKEAFSQITVKSFDGESVTIKEKFDDYELVFFWDKQPIPPRLGGPVQFCQRNQVSNCQYFVSDVVVGN
jgi:hypothetical protein